MLVAGIMAGMFAQKHQGNPQRNHGCLHTASAMATGPFFRELSKKLKPILLLTADKFFPARAHHRQAETLTPTAPGSAVWSYPKKNGILVPSWKVKDAV